MANFDGALNIADNAVFGKRFKDPHIESFKKGLTNVNQGQYSDPTFLGFVLLFDWQSPLLNPSIEGDTALAYLKRIGDDNRFRDLQAFQSILRSLNKQMPWYWQTIEGLDKAWELMTKVDDPFRGGPDSLIGIGTLESVDLRMTSIMSLYRKAAFDSTYRREVIPRNLRKFNVQIFIQEIRKFNTVLNAVDKLGALGVPQNKTVGEQSGMFDGKFTDNFMTKGSRDTARVVGDNISKIMFNFIECEMAPELSVDLFSSVSNADPQVAASKFAFRYNDLTEFSNFSLLDFVLQDIKDNPDDRKETFGEKVKDRMVNLGKETAMNQANQLVNSAEQFARSKVNNLLLGNVYGALQGNSAINSLVRGSIDGVVRDVNIERDVLGGFGSTQNT